MEMPAVMARYNPFAERAGMRKIAEQPPPKEALKIAETLHSIGFNIRLLGSEKYILSKLQSLSKMEIQSIKEAFIKRSIGTQRISTLFSLYNPFVRRMMMLADGSCCKVMMRFCVFECACMGGGGVVYDSNTFTNEKGCGTYLHSVEVSNSENLNRCLNLTPALSKWFWMIFPQFWLFFAHAKIVRLKINRVLLS